MKRLRPLMLFVGFGLVGFALFAFNFKKTTVAEIDRDLQHHFDLGFVPLGHVFTKTVSVTNKSTETWKLKEIRQSCSCSQAEVERHLLKPGESTDVTVQFTSPDQEADSRHSVQLLFQADCQPSVTISVQSKTRKPLSVDRKHLEITTTNLKPIAMVELMVRNHSGIPWSTVCCDELPTHIHVQSCKKLPSVDQVETWKLEIAIDGSQYDEHIQDNTKYDSVQVATVTKSGKKSWAEGAAVVCISSKGCNTCKFVGGENPWLCQADGNNNGAIESRLPTSPTGDDCSLPPP